MSGLDLLFWVVLLAFAVSGFFQWGKNLVKSFRDKKFVSVAQSWILMILSLAAGKMLQLAKFQNENEYYALILGLVIAGVAQFGYETFIQAKFIKAIIEKVFGCKIPDDDTAKAKNE